MVKIKSDINHRNTTRHKEHHTAGTPQEHHTAQAVAWSNYDECYSIPSQPLDEMLADYRTTLNIISPNLYI